MKMGLWEVPVNISAFNYWYFGVEHFSLLNDYEVIIFINETKIRNHNTAM